MRGRIQPSDLSEVERFGENFHHGLGNMSTTAGAGTVTHVGAGTDGGYAELATGTISTGDVAELRVDTAYDPVAYDVIEFSTEFETSTDDSALLDARPISALSQNRDEEVRYHASDDEFVSGRNRTKYIDSVDTINATKRHRATIRWYTARGVIRLYLDGKLWHEDTTTSEHPQTSASYTARALVITESTAADRLLRIYRYSVAYYIDRSTR